jgi:N-acyl-D-aspartate/D-glutamate deacylase
MFIGLKLSITFAVIGAVVGEYVAADRGLGYQILSATAFFKTSLAFGADAALHHKIAAGDSAVATVGELVAAVTTEAAAAIGRDDIGRLAPGLRADLVAIDLGGSHLRPVSDPLKALVWRACAHDVWATMVDGRLLVNEGRYLAGDETRITEAGASAIEKVWSHPEAQKFLRRAL